MNNLDEKYRKLQETLDKNPIGAPYSEEFIEILRIMFPPDELDLALLLSFSFSNLSDIAEKGNMSKEDAVVKLEAMADKGAILSKKTKDESRSYCLLPNYPGLYEYPIMACKDPETLKRLSELWSAYYMKDMWKELIAVPLPWERVLPTEEAIPEDAPLELVDEVLPYEVASKLIETTKAICVGDCPCRVIEKNCDRPLDVCMAFNGAAEFMIERGMAKRVTLEEAKVVLKRAEEAGLVHLGSNNKKNLLFICNCCSCCCHMLRLKTEFDAANGGIAKSSYIIDLNASECNGCGICAEDRCPTKALTMESGIANLSALKCIGCGLCVSTCPTQCLSLNKRNDYVEPLNTLTEIVQYNFKNKQK